MRLVYRVYREFLIREQKTPEEFRRAAIKGNSNLKLQVPPKRKLISRRFDGNGSSFAVKYARWIEKRCVTRVCS